MKRTGDRWWLALCVVVLAAATIVAYSGALEGEFVYDDPILIADNPLVTGSDADLGAIFQSEFFGGGGGASGFYRPLMVLVYRIEFSLFGLDPFWFHLVNVVTHAAAAIVLLLLMRALGSPPLIALAGGLFFALHPVNVESVAWIAAGANATAFLFMGLALLFIVRFARSVSPTWKSLDLWLGVGALIPALLTKETALVVPAAAFLLLSGRLPGQRHRQSGRLLFFLPFLIVAALFVFTHVLVVGGAEEDLLFQGRGTTLERLVTFLECVPAYMKLFVWPVGLNIARPLRLTEAVFSIPVLAGGAFLFLSLLLLAWSWRRGERDLLLGVALLVFTLLSVSTLIPIAYAYREMDFPFFERYLYVASAGLAILLAAVSKRVAGRVGIGAPALWARRGWLGIPLVGWPAGVLVGSAIVLLGSATYSRCQEWHDDVSLFTKGVDLYPSSPSLNLNKGFSLQRVGRHREAIQAFQKAALYDPTLTMARVNEAISLNEIGARAKAESILREILQAEPDNEQALRVLATILAWRGELEKAFGLYCKAFRLSGGDVMLERNLALLLTNMRLKAEQLYIADQKDDAVALADLILADVPKTAWAWEVKGLVLAERGEGLEGVAALERAVRLTKDSLVGAARLAEIYRRQGRESKALEMELYIDEGRKRLPEGSLPAVND